MVDEHNNWGVNDMSSYTNFIISKTIGYNNYNIHIYIYHSMWKCTNQQI